MEQNSMKFDQTCCCISNYAIIIIIIIIIILCSIDSGDIDARPTPL